MATDLVYGSIFTLYIACFIFIGAYMMVRRRRKEQDQEVLEQEQKKKS